MDEQEAFKILSKEFGKPLKKGLLGEYYFLGDKLKDPNSFLKFLPSKKSIQYLFLSKLETESV